MSVTVIAIFVRGLAAYFLIRAVIGAAVGTASDSVERQISKQRKPTATFSTSLSVVDALEAGREVAAHVRAGEWVEESEPGRVGSQPAETFD